MTPTRYRDCLNTLGLSQRGLAPILRCSERLPRAWATGREIIPSEVADWLEAWVAIRLAHPDPSPPENWSRRRSPTATVGKAARTALPPGDCEINSPTEITTLNDERPGPVLTSLDGNAHREDVCQIVAQDRNPSMTARNNSDVLTEITAKLEQFGLNREVN